MRGTWRSLLIVLLLVMGLLVAPAVPAMAFNRPPVESPAIELPAVPGCGAEAQSRSDDEECPGGRCKTDHCSACCKEFEKASCDGENCECKTNWGAVGVAIGIGILIVIASA